MVLMTLPQYIYSQNSSKQSTAASPKGNSWMPVNKFKSPTNKKQEGSEVIVTPPLINVLNGVSFYIKNTVCNTSNVVLLKLINTNNYPVKVSWQLNSKSPITFFIVPSRRVSEGACSPSNNIETTELIIEKPSGTKAEKEKIKQFLLSSITVAQVTE